MDSLLEKLNSEQIKPVLDTEGAVLVLAGAGSGKTRVLTTRIAYIIESGKADMSQILAITFTNKAAGEMKERLLDMLGDDGGGRWICTIHSMCVKILRQFSERAEIASNFSIYGETERANVIKKAYSELGISDEELLKSAKYHIGNAKMLGLDPDLYEVRNSGARNIAEVTEIYKIYNKRLRENNALDFDDLLTETLRLLRRDKEVREYLSDKFKYIHVDEFQDTNAVQYNIIKLLASVHGNIFAVGDDDQSIYGWRGAEIDNILKFDKDFPKAKVYKLERNYRSTKSILEFANAVIKNNVRRKNKTLWTEAAEGERPTLYEADEELDEALFTARTIARGVADGGKYSDYAVLMRINALTRPYEQEFTKYGIPYKVFGGFKFFERKEVKDVLAYLRLISNPYDNEAFERIINVPRRGIGLKTIEVMRKYAAESSLSLYDAAVDCDCLELNGGAKSKIADFARLIREFVLSAQSEPVNVLVREVMDTTDIRSAYDDGTDDGDGKLANLDEFIASVDDFTRLNPHATLDEYLNQVTLASDIDEMDGGDYVTLATIHSVKGLEFDCVFVCGLEEGIMPSTRSDTAPRQEEEERRLMYVAITRARKRLYLTRSKSRYLYGKRDMKERSRFIRELSFQLGLPKTKSAFSRFRPSGRDFESSFGYESDFPAQSGAFSGGASAFKPSLGGARAQNPVPGAGAYRVGMRVRHPKFGFGMIVSLKNNGAVLDVAFEKLGIKELAASIAPLEIL